MSTFDATLRVVLSVDDDHRLEVRQALTTLRSVQVHETTVSAESLSTLRRCDALVLEATDRIFWNSDGSLAFYRVRRIRQHSPPLVLLVSTHSRRMLGSVLRLGRHIDFEVAVWNDATDSQSLRGAILTAAAASLSIRVVESVQHSVNGRLDPRIQMLLWDLFRFPETYSSTDRVLNTLLLTSATVNRLLRASGLWPLERLRTASRVARAYSLLTKHRVTVKQCARQVGCGSDDTLWRACRDVTGRSPAVLRECGSEDDIHGLLVRYCVKSANTFASRKRRPDLALETIISPIREMN